MVNELYQHADVPVGEDEMFILAILLQLALGKCRSSSKDGDSAFCDDVHELDCPWFPNVVALIIIPHFVSAWSEPYDPPVGK